MMLAESSYLIRNGQIFELGKTEKSRRITSSIEAYEIAKSLSGEKCKFYMEIKNIEFQVVEGSSASEPELKGFIRLSERDIEITNISMLPEYYCDEEYWIPISKSSSEDGLALFQSIGVADLGRLNVAQAMYISIQGRRLVPQVKVLWDESQITLPPSLAKPQLHFGSPYEYQKQGYEWLVWLRQMGIGGLLGDEMGLGKTLQLIMVLQNELEHNRSPNLIVCPPSILENWRRELLKFVEVIPYIHQGKSKRFDQKFLSSQNVVLISYDALRTDQHYLDQIRWNLIGLDEAQYIKNPLSQRTLAVKSLQKECGIAITGTPIENRIEDLWSILDFTCKGLLGDQRWFESNFSENPQAIQELRSVIKPTLLRRRVREVAQDLPDLTIKPVHLELPESLYSEYRAMSIHPAQDRREASGRFMRKRKMCNHISGSLSEFVSDEDDGKIQYLRDSFESISASGMKGIIFIPFTVALIGLDKWFRRNFDNFFVDHYFGGTPTQERQKIIDNFSSFSGSGVLLLNPKAGGVGLNITAANHVFHFSPDWNPAVMDQASARSFRRGQHLPVTIHNMRYEGTVEVDMYARLDDKRAIAEEALLDSELIPTLEELNAALARMPKERQ